MQIKQWEDKNLSQYSYAVLSDREKKIILIDPSRNPQPYLDFAKANDAVIVGILETHPHADFISSHAELSQLTGAVIYTHSLVGALYPHRAFDEGEEIVLEDLKLRSIHTPGHSPDSISILLLENGKQKAVFTGDTLFIGDCGRPDLRESAGNLQSKREDLAKEMYYSLRKKLMTLDDDVIVYPAHGAGTLCGKNLSAENRSTIGQEKLTNWSLQEASEEEFIRNLLADQPFVPAYFPFDVEVNRKGADPLKESLSKVKIKELKADQSIPVTDSSVWIVDVRSQSVFKKGHLPHSINLMEDGKFETWLGSIIMPGEKFYLAGESAEQVQKAIERAAAIGYETAIESAFIINGGPVKEADIDVSKFKNNINAFTIVDVRNRSEVKEGKIFSNGISIPLTELRSRINEIPVDKPVVIHCAAGYRSAAGSSILGSVLNDKVKVYDLSEAIKEFEPVPV
jgi:hydroxyacylglutathione hydrolase